MRVYFRNYLAVFLFFCLALLSHAGFAQIPDDLKTEIYPKLRDKRCATMTLAQCDCPDAREMKAYIEALAEAGINKDEIFYKVAKKFTLNTILDEQIKQAVEKRLVKEAGEKRPRIILEISSFDFGKVSKKQGKLTKNIKLFNRGDSDLVIKNIKVSCSCVTAALVVDKNKSPYFGVQGSPADWKAVIGPRKNGELEIVLDLAHSSIPLGEVSRNVFIGSNDPLYPESALKIEAEVSL